MKIEKLKNKSKLTKKDIEWMFHALEKARNALWFYRGQWHMSDTPEEFPNAVVYEGKKFYLEVEDGSKAHEALKIIEAVK